MGGLRGADEIECVPLLFVVFLMFYMKLVLSGEMNMRSRWVDFWGCDLDDFGHETAV